jgi:hypothetical protein
MGEQAVRTPQEADPEGELLTSTAPAQPTHGQGIVAEPGPPGNRTVRRLIMGQSAREEPGRPRRHAPKQAQAECAGCKQSQTSIMAA